MNDSQFPLWRLKPEDAARIIILAPLQAVERHKHWHKRIPRTHPSKCSKPRVDDVQALNRAKWDGYWEAYLEAWAEAFPVAAQKARAVREPIANPLASERERPPFEGMYSRAQYEMDLEYFEEARAKVRENFILGQQGEGPYMDGLLFMKLDNLMLAEMAHCKARLDMTRAIMANKAKTRAVSESDVWKSIGGDESVAMQFKHSGHTVRKVGLHSYEILMNPRKKRTA